MEKEWLADDCFYIDKRENASRILGYLRGDRTDVPIVEDNGRPYAIIDPRAAMRRGIRSGMHVEKLAWPVPVIQDGDSTAGVLAKFATSGAPWLPAFLGRPPRKAGYLDANNFLQVAFETGPFAVGAAQGLPPLWRDSNIEDAAQAFAASALPYLPVLGDDDNVTGIVRRQSLMPYMEQDPTGMGRQDVAGDRSGFRQEPIDALIDDLSPVLDADADYNAVTDALDQQPCWFVIHDGVQAVTAVSMLQAIYATNAPAQESAAHFRQTNS